MNEQVSVIGGPDIGVLYDDTRNGDTVEILHVAPAHVIVQRKDGVNRYPRADFGEGERFVPSVVEEGA